MGIGFRYNNFAIELSLLPVHELLLGIWWGHYHTGEECSKDLQIGAVFALLAFKVYEETY
jgi:hypothetical protein